MSIRMSNQILGRRTMKTVPAHSTSGAGRRGNWRTAFGVVALIVMTTAGMGAISASADEPAATNANQLVGSWIATVDRGPSLPPLRSLVTYSEGNTVIENANVGATVRSAAHGAWERIGGRTYGTTTEFFRYDPVSGAYAGTIRIRSTLELAHDGQSFTGVAVAELRDPAGNLLPGSNTRRDHVTAERIVVEPVPDVPLAPVTSPTCPRSGGHCLSTPVEN